jgi:hypothetical protein
MGDPMDILFDPPKTKPPVRHRRKPEAKIQKEIVRWLVQHGAVVAITDAGALSKFGLGAKCGIPVGWPDITACLPGGRFLGVECKAPKGVQSEAQVRFQIAVEKRGGIYILARSLAELVVALDKEKVLENLV